MSNPEAPDASMLVAKVEAILFVAEGSLSINQLCDALEAKSDDIEKAIAYLKEHYENSHGIRIQKHANKFQLVSAPEFGELIERFLGLEANARLTKASLETLAIIAYKQPITRPGIDAIRGVNSDGVLKSLLFKGLIEESGRAETPGRPILFSTTQDFLQYFGIRSLEELPCLDLGELENNPNETPKLLKD